MTEYEKFIASKLTYANKSKDTKVHEKNCSTYILVPFKSAR